MSYQVKVKVYGESSFNGNAMRFATTEEAESYAKDLYSRWTLMDEYKVEESTDAVNYTWVNGRSVPVRAESGQVLIAVAILMLIIVVGMYIVGHSMGVDFNAHVGPTCYDYLNAAGQIVGNSCQ